ncbi:hypothetical protein Nmel_017655, partial [Mimus melanotis]
MSQHYQPKPPCCSHSPPGPGTNEEKEPARPWVPSPSVLLLQKETSCFFSECCWNCTLVCLLLEQFLLCPWVRGYSSDAPIKICQLT